MTLMSQMSTDVISLITNQRIIGADENFRGSLMHA